MPRGRLTQAIPPILAGTAAAVLVGNAPKLSYTSPAPLAATLPRYATVVPGQAAVTLGMVAHSPREWAGR